MIRFVRPAHVEEKQTVLSCIATQNYDQKQNSTQAIHLKMDALINPLVGFVGNGFAHVWCGMIQLLSANVSAIASSLELVPMLGGVSASLGQGGIAVGQVITIWGAASQILVSFASDLTFTALVVVGFARINPPEAIGVTKRDWQRLNNASSAISSLTAWSDQTLPDVPENFLPAARIMAIASALSYAELKDAKEIMTSSLWSLQLIDGNDAQAMIFKASNQPLMIVAFRGSQLPLDNAIQHTFWSDVIRNSQFIPDWIRNFDVLLTPYHDGSDGDRGLQVHKGFWSGWNALRVALQEEIRCYAKEHHREVIQLYVTGHSQGAGLAGVSLLDLIREQQSHGYKVKGCLTFATPKHGNMAYTIAVAAVVAKDSIPLELVANCLMGLAVIRSYRSQWQLNSFYIMRHRQAGCGLSK